MRDGLPSSSASPELQRFELLLFLHTLALVKRGLLLLSGDEAACLVTEFCRPLGVSLKYFDFPVSQDWSLLTVFLDLGCGC